MNRLLSRWMLVLVSCAICRPAVAVDSPNIIIVLVDDFGWGDPACYGNTMLQTPNMDRLAKEGIRFTQGYVAAPICSPSRCGLITGQFPGRWRITSFLQTKAGNRACGMDDYLDPNATTLPRVLKQSGYATAHIGKWHLGGGRDVTDAPKFAAYGYDCGLGTYESPEPAAPLGLKTTPWGPQNQLESQQVPRYKRSQWMVDEALQFVASNPKRPVFINLWLDDTHTPFVPSEEQIETVRTPGDSELKSKYKAVLSELDKQLGRLIEGLRQTNTLLLFLGDNGASPPFERERAAGLRGQKLSLYEGGIRVPMIAWWSNRKMDGLVNDRTVLSTIDFLPTLASLCQAPLPELYQSDGENLSRALSGELMVRSRPLYWEYGRNDESFAYPKDAFHRSPNVAVREGIWKLMVNANGTDVQLYNMSTDRNETQDVSTLYPEITRRLKEMALAWRMNLP